MKTYIKYLAGILLVTFLLFEGIVIGILKYPSGVFYSSYQSVIQDKYRILKEMNDPKIIIVSGSYSAFGLDQDMLEEATGYKVANLGLHIGFGPLFYSELAKTNINKGDVVLLGYEYGWYDWYDGFSSLDQRLIMSGIDDDIEMYTKIPIETWPDFVGYLFKYAEVKNSYEGSFGIYSREAFDTETGQMIMPRDDTFEYTEDKYGFVDIEGATISQETEEYLKDFKQYVEEQGAEVYFISAPIVADVIGCDYGEFDKLKELEESQVGIPYISNPTDYIFPCGLMSDGIYHCNSKGEKVRTELLIRDLKRAEIID